MPDATPDVSPAQWRLSADGRRAAESLCRRLPANARLVSSAEPKAWETLGGSSAVVRDTRFREIDRPVEPWSDDFREVRARYVAGLRHDGWEAHADVIARFQSGIDEHLGAQTLIVATHGMAMTTWLVGVGALPVDDAEDFWRGLRLPDCHAVDLGSRSVARMTGLTSLM